MGLDPGSEPRPGCAPAEATGTAKLEISITTLFNIAKSCFKLHFLNHVYGMRSSLHLLADDLISAIKTLQAEPNPAKPTS